MNIVAELPFFKRTCGGVKSTIRLAEKFTPKMQVRFQKLKGEYPQIDTIWTVGLADNTFPECDICLTYSDNPYIHDLLKSKNIGRVVVNMLSYGMSIENERRNASLKDVKVICSTKKIEDAIKSEGKEVTRVGFPMDMELMQNEHNQREDYLAIMYHPMISKRYDLAVKISDILLSKKIIKGVISFGSSEEYGKHPKPKGLVRHYMDANRHDIHDVFNMCKCYLMPSLSEGLNLTPIESTLCGCPSILCDGAINEIFKDGNNCHIGKKDGLEQMASMVEYVIKHFDENSGFFEENMRETIKPYTWEKYLDNMHKALGI